MLELSFGRVAGSQIMLGVGRMITQEMTINEALRQYPQTITVFADVGLDTCCGGAQQISEAALKHGLDPAELLAKANACIEEEYTSCVRMCSL